MHAAAEFEAFGPWIDRVRALDEVPRLYRDAGVDPAACRLVLKVPRNIDRRDAVAGMHLYDHLIAVGWETLTVLQRRGERYEHIVVPLDQVAVIEHSVNLLDGRLRISTVDGGLVAVAYNAADEAPVRELITVLRELYAPADPGLLRKLGGAGPGAGDGSGEGSGDGFALPAPYGHAGGALPVEVYVQDGAASPRDPYAALDPVLAGATEGAGLGRPWLDLGVEDIGLAGAYQQVIAEEPGMALVNATLRRRVAAAGTVGRARDRMRPVTLHAGITVADQREVQVIHRRDWFTTGPAKVRSVATTVVPRTRISGLQVLPHERYEGVNVLVVEAGYSSVTIPVPAGPDTEALLARLGTPPLPGDWISPARP